jgi:hypothetical protein
VIWLAFVAHAGSGFALLVTLSGQLRPALLATAHPGHTLALEPGLRMLLIAYASTPRLTAIPMAAIAWQRAGRVGREHTEFRRWFGAGCVVLAAESVVRAAAALAVSPQMTPALWVVRLRPPFPVVSAAVTMIVAGVCWALALGEATAARRGSADGPDVWPLAVAFVLRLG